MRPGRGRTPLSTPPRAMAQVRGRAVELPAQSTDGAVRAAILPFAATYANSLMVQIAQTAACNRLHSVEQRTARWILQAADSARTDDLELTHEFLAMML